MEATQFLNRQKRKIINIALILLALVVANNISKQHQKEIQLLKEQCDQEKKKSDVLISLNKAQKRILVFKKFLARKEASLLIKDISNIAQEQNLKIISLKPLAEQRGADFVKLPFDLSASLDSYHALGKFISRIESSDNVYLVENVRIFSNEETRQLTVNLTISNICFAD
jgi:Tfp pilus assembly protein PilO